MAIVKLISGRIVENVQLTDVEHVGDEGSRNAMAHIDGKTYHVYNSIIDGFNPVWVEQMTYETWKMLKETASNGFIEGTVASSDESGES